MKFSDGNWLVPEDLSLLHPLHMHEVYRDGDTLVAHVSSKVQRSRGDQLNTAVFTLRLFSPTEGVIGVRLTHFSGDVARSPCFYVSSQDHPIEIVETDSQIALHSGALSASLPRSGTYKLDFSRDGRRLTGSRTKGTGYAVQRPTKTPFVFESLDLAVGENVYGLGERFSAFVKNGQHVEIWNRDGGTGTDQAYKNIPFFVTNKGWGLFVNHPGRVDFEIGSERVSAAQFSVGGEELEYFVIDGPTPKQVLERYTGLTGRPPLPPAWSFGLWLTTSFTTSYDEATVNGFVDGMHDRNIPLHVFHFDCFWMRGTHWCDFDWDPATFPDPQGQLARLRERGLKVCLWINPYISQLSSLFAEAKANNYLLRRADGSVWQWDLWQPGQGIVDFTNPAACAWYTGHLKRLLDMGVDCFKTDFGERIPTDVVWYNGGDPDRMHNYYAYLYNKVVFDLLKAERGDDAVVFARSATVGSQLFPVHWGGDCDSDYASMAESLRGGLSLGLSGFGFWSHDIGGFEGTAKPDVYKRWCAFGLLSSHSRLHGSDSYRVPWAFDDEAVDVLRHFVQLKCRLMPYLHNAAVEATEIGAPLLRAMLLEFPQDPGTHTLDRQYMLGGSLLVAPVFSAEGECDVYLPAGRWTNYFTGEEVEGGWRHERHDFFGLPLYVRENTLLAIGSRADRPDYDYASSVTLELYALQDGATARCRITDTTGAIVARISVSRQGRAMVVEADSDFSWSLTLIGVEAAGEDTTATPRGCSIQGRGAGSFFLGHR